MSSCPGSRCGVPCAHDVLLTDVECIVQQGIRIVVSLLAADELERLGAKNLPYQLAQHGIAWYQLPVVDFGVPSLQVTAQWLQLMPALKNALQTGPVLIHCAHGKGRTGTMVATLFKAWGWHSEEAIAWTRQCRVGAIENLKQEAYVRAFESPLQHCKQLITGNDESNARPERIDPCDPKPQRTHLASKSPISIGGAA